MKIFQLNKLTKAKRTSRKLAAILMGFSLAVLPLRGASQFGGGHTGPRPPNIVVVLIDDLGFSGFSSFGGPIRTPNIDKLARRGLRYNNFHVTSLCSPTRAALLSGRNHHSAGTGVITEIATERPGYLGKIPKSVALLPKLLKQKGYVSMALGKWHNTPIEALNAKGPFDEWPTGKGFDHFYGFMGGDTTQWQTPLWENNKPIQAPKENFHLTPALTDRALEYAKQNAKSPFFMYFAPGAAHAPHHAPKEFSDRYRGQFDEGWDTMRVKTLARMKELGIVPANTELSERPKELKSWSSLSKDEKRLYARMMEVYAGFVEQTDYEVGRLLDGLQEMGAMDNTLVIVTTDNGSSGEGGPFGTVNESRFFNNMEESLEENLKMIDKIGGPETFNHFPAGWAHAVNTPMKYWKQFVHHGGVRVPLVISWPGKIKDEGAIRNQFTHVIDIVPTILELVEMKVPKVVEGEKQKPIEGVSMVPHLLLSSAPTQKKVQYFEMFANRGVWADGWKAVVSRGVMPWQGGKMEGRPPFESDHWELYDTTVDVSEFHDLSAKYPEKVKAMKVLFDREAKKYNVYPLDERKVERLAALMERLVGNRKVWEYTEVETRITEQLGPLTKNRSHRITASVTIPESGCEGALTEAGGRYGGYSFFCKNGKLYFAHNLVGEITYLVESTERLPSGPVQLRVSFEKTGVEKGLTKGVARLFLNGKKVGEGEIPKTVPVTFGLADFQDVGTATGTSVTDMYETPFPFNGKIQKILFELDKI